MLRKHPVDGMNFMDNIFVHTVCLSLTDDESWHGAERVVEQVRQKRENIGETQILAPFRIQ
jgi:hypothetical protein